MSLINKIRDKSWLLLLVIGIAMVAFILGDLFSSNSALLSGNQQIIGEIDGNEISLQEFNNIYERDRSNYTNSSGQIPNEFVDQSFRQSAWQQLVDRLAYQQQLDDLGITVSEEEQIDMVQGNNIDPNLARSFIDSTTNQVDRNAIKNYLANLDRLPPVQQLVYYNFEQSLVQNRKKQKYENLLNKSHFATTIESKREYIRQNKKVDIQYLYVPYSTIPDSLVDYTETDLKNHYTTHREKYKKVANRAIEYISFPITATTDDDNAVKQSLFSLISRFEATTSDSAFIAANSESSNNFLLANPDDVPSIDKATMEIGMVYGPFKESNAYKIYKFIDVKEDTVMSAKASHILIKTDNRTEEEAKTKANELLKELKEGADFATLAKNESEDFSNKATGGNLGWFKAGVMAPAFNDAVMQAQTVGLISKLVKTTFGYHIIHVLELPTNEKYHIGIIEKEVAPSDATISKVYQQVGKFARYKMAEKFVAAVEADSTVILYQALTVRSDARNINNLSGKSIRSVVLWAYNDLREVGDVSDIFDLDDKFLIAILREKTEEGRASFEDVQQEVKREFINEKKKIYIVEKLQTTTGSLAERQAAFGELAKIDANNDISLNSNTLIGAGSAPRAIGTAMALKTGQVSNMIIDESAVIILRVNNKNEALETADYSVYQKQLESKFAGPTTFKIAEAIKEFFAIKDYRYKYF